MVQLTKASLAWYRGDDWALESAQGRVVAQVNPNELTFEKSAKFSEIPIPGLDAPIMQFVRGEAETLRVELFFDTTESGEPVTKLTDQVYGLVKIDSVTHAPPICSFQWGEEGPGSQIGDTSCGGISEQQNQRRTHFVCVVERVSQRFTLFDRNGRPLRAVLSLSLKEYRSVPEQVEVLRLESNDHTRQYVVSEGATLPGIAAEVFGRSSEWRAIADHNGIVDPLEITVGQVLEIPPIQ